MKGRALYRLDDRWIPADPGEIRCFTVVRNGSWRLPFFLQHHRTMGINRFFFIDNASEDDTREVLLKQHDVHVWHTSQEYGKTNHGMDWVHQLLDVYGIGSWCVILDIDELLTFRKAESTTLRSMIHHLEHRGANAGRAVMLDMYSDKDIRDTHYTQGTNFLESCPYFEFPFLRHKIGKSLYKKFTIERYPLLDMYLGAGTVRHRVFGVKSCMRKYPVIQFTSGMRLASGCHGILTGAKLDPDIHFVLFHFKFFADFWDAVEEEVRREQHWNKAEQYKRYARFMNRPITLFSDRSIRYRNTMQLVDLGILC